MTKLISTVIVVSLGLVAVGAVGPSIAAVFNAFIPLVLVIGLLAVVLRIVWWRTGRW